MRYAVEALANEIKFNDIPFFNGDKGFSVVYLEGELHLFFVSNSFLCGRVCHFVSRDGYAWEQRAEALNLRRRLDSVAAYAQGGKIYLYCATKNPLCGTDIYLAISKDTESFLLLPRAILKHTALRDIKIVYSEGERRLIGSEAKEGRIPAYVSSGGAEWIYAPLKNLSEDAEECAYLGAPSPFVAYNKTYIAYSMLGARIAEAQIDLSEGAVTLGKAVLETECSVIRSVMLGSGTPLLFAGFGKAIVPAEAYPADDGVGFRIYREAIKKARLCAYRGEEASKKIARECGVMHHFWMPACEWEIEAGGISLKASADKITLKEAEIYTGASEKREITLLDMGNALVFELCGGIYPLIAIENQAINISCGYYNYTRYKL